MGKRSKDPKKKSKAAAKEPVIGDASDPLALCAEAEACNDSLDVLSAVSLYQRALELDGGCLLALNGLAEACLETGDRDQAVAALRRSVELAPDGDASRYMNLGQLAESDEALGWFERGVSILRAAYGAKKSVEHAHALATALCAVAEVFLTDRCDDDDAEARCQAMAEEAVALVAPLAQQTLCEPYVTLASLRMSQQRDDDACAALKTATAIITDAPEDAPAPMDVRMACAKMLMEVGEALEALDLLQMLRLEHEDSLELWYITGAAALQADEPQLALEEASAACDFAQSEACPEEERGWLEQLMELREEARAAAQASAE